MHTLASRCVLVAAMALGTAPAGSQVLYHVTPLGGIPGGNYYSVPLEINDAGQITGHGAVNSRDQAFLWTPGAGTIGLPQLAAGEGINQLGHVVGVGSRGLGQEAVLWTPETGVTYLGDLPGGIFNSLANAVNDHDQVVGYGRSALGDEAFLWDEATGMVGLGDLPGGQFRSIAGGINNRTQVCGSSGSARALGEAFIWDPENGMRPLPPLPGGSLAFGAGCINERGQVVGNGPTAQGIEGFLWDPNDGYTLIGFLPGYVGAPASVPYDLNDLGEIVGYSRLSMVRIEPFIWDAQRGMRNLDERLDPCTPFPYNDLRFAAAINNHGQIAAYTNMSAESVFLDPYIAADPDLDGDTDLTDLATVLANFGRTQVPSFAEGDVDEDADVDLDDLAHVLVNFGNDCP